jgi:hypothetical protein
MIEHNENAIHYKRNDTTLTIYTGLMFCAGKLNSSSSSSSPPPPDQ